MRNYRFLFSILPLLAAPLYGAVTMNENVRGTNNSYYFNTTSSYTVLGSTIQASTATLTVGGSGLGNVALGCIKFPSGFQCDPGVSSTTASTSYILNQNTLQSGATFFTSSGTANAFNAVTINVSTLTPSIGIVGTTTNNDAPTADIGWYNVNQGTVTIIGTSGVYQDIAQVTVPSGGDYDVRGGFMAIRNGSTFTSTAFEAGFTTVAGNNCTGCIEGLNYMYNAGLVVPTTFTFAPMDLPTFRVSLSGPGTIYLKCLLSVFTVGNPQAKGTISVRRVR